MDDKLFSLYWQEWESKLKEVARRGSATLTFPMLIGPSRGDDGSITYRPDKPLVLHNVPQKGTSGKLARNTIFVNGHFKFRRQGEHLVMASAGANLTIYNVKRKDQDLNVTLFDALHFDFEEVNAQKPFHPMFHVQRGPTNTLTENVVRAYLASQPGITADMVKFLPGNVSGSPYLRFPCPQLDYFSVLVMIIADFFCNPEEKDANKNMTVIFKGLLRHLCDDRNIARQGEASRVLFGRSQDRGWSSAADWYAESVA